jgi:hypothetical protein
MSPLSGVLLAIALFAILLLLLELGRRTGRRRRAGDPERAGVAVVEGALFTLFGLLIAFTFSGAASRFDWHRQLLVEEANAIGTAYLRLDLLPAEAQPALRAKFREYVRARLDLYEAVPDSATARRALARATALHDEIWSLSIAGSRPEPATRVVVLPALNAMFDIVTTRAVAAQTHPPGIILLLLVALALVSAVLVGEAMAVSPLRSWTHMGAFALMIALTVYVIVDLEYPRHGLIGLKQFDQVLVELLEKMR